MTKPKLSTLHVIRGRSGLYHIVLKGGNHKIRLSGETYVRRYNAYRALLKLSKDLGLPVS